MNKFTKMVNGTIIKIVFSRLIGRASTSLRFHWELGGGATKQPALSLHSFVGGEVTPSGGAQGAEATSHSIRHGCFSSNSTPKQNGYFMTRIPFPFSACYTIDRTHC